MADGSGSIHVHVFGRSDIGLVRTTNEDHFIVGDLDDHQVVETEDDAYTADVRERGPLFVVCDGMGGAAAGEVASKLASEVVWEEMCDAEATDNRAVFARHLRRAVRTANRRVWEESVRNPARRGMGTTLSAAGVVGNALIIAQVGDSRAYIQRGDALTQVTRDQSIVSALLHAGRITEEEAKNFGQSNIILQALGVSEDVEVALSIVELRRGDRLVLCSDGLHGPIGDLGVHSILAAEPDDVRVVDALIARARAAGGPDNITVVLATFSGDGLAAPVNADDLPRFVEFDPMEDGARALSTTSRIARRLAARAGVGEDPGPPPIPATGQHMAVQPLDTRGGLPAGPATDQLEERARVGLLAWVMVAIAIAALGVLLLWDRL